MDNIRTTKRLMNRAQKLAGVMEQRKFETEVCANMQQAVKRVLSLIPKGKRVACEDSQILRKLKLAERLKEGEYQYIERNRRMSAQKTFQQLEQLEHSEVFVTDVHAISKNGVLVLSENTGSRIAAMTFGADEVIVIAGMDRVCKSEKTAIRYARRIAGSNSNYELCIRGCVIPGRIRVILVAECLRE